MSILPDSPCRGCAAAFPQPVDESEVARLVRNVSVHNSGIIYRSSDRDHDITHHVFRWSSTYYREVFECGFQAKPQRGTPNAIYFNLDHYVNHGGTPLDPSRPLTHVFISTTLSSSWRPTPSLTTLPQGGQIRVYRYEIYAPGGILVRQTLGARRYLYRAQDEVYFVRGIAPQYIRSAQLFIGTRGVINSRFVSWRRADRRIMLNVLFNPQSHPQRMLAIQRPVFDYLDYDGSRPPLTIVIWQGQLPQCRWMKRDACLDGIVDWYAGSVADSPGYINAAFRSSRHNEAYLFMQNEYVLVNYAPGRRSDRILNGPLLICDGYPSLSGTPFGEYGIDCAFSCRHGNEAFIFSGNLCACIDYAPGTRNDRILSGPMTITAMFPFLSQTVFANSIDAAFTSSARNEAYLFKGDAYALINYYYKTCIAIRKIRDGFHGLRNTMFERGIEAAFASHRRNEAYIFKGDHYALINFAPGTTKDYIIGCVKPIAPNWPSLRILPRTNRGLDEHHHHYHDQEQAHPEHHEL